MPVGPVTGAALLLGEVITADAVAVGLVVVILAGAAAATRNRTAG